MAKGKNKKLVVVRVSQFEDGGWDSKAEVVGVAEVGGQVVVVLAVDA